MRTFNIVIKSGHRHFARLYPAITSLLRTKYTYGIERFVL